MRPVSYVSNAFLIVGVITLFLGTIFLLQSNSFVGPTSSFMYRNPQWTANGYVIIGAGAVVTAIALIKKYFKVY
jgi:hypothetical protein